MLIGTHLQKNVQVRMGALCSACYARRSPLGKVKWFFCCSFFIQKHISWADLNVFFFSGGQFTWGTRVIWTTSSRRGSEYSEDVRMVLMNLNIALFILTVTNTCLKPTNIIKLILMIVFTLTIFVKVLCMMLSLEVWGALLDDYDCEKCHHSSILSKMCGCLAG